MVSCAVSNSLKLHTHTHPVVSLSDIGLSFLSSTALKFLLWLLFGGSCCAIINDPFGTAKASAAQFH